MSGHFTCEIGVLQSTVDPQREDLPAWAGKSSELGAAASPKKASQDMSRKHRQTSIRWFGSAACNVRIRRSPKKTKPARAPHPATS